MTKIKKRKTNNNKYLIPILIVIIVIGIILFFILKPKNSYSIKTRYTINSCKKDCNIKETNYNQLKSNIPKNAFKKIIDKVNKQVTKSYEEDINSPLDGNDCKKEKDNLNNRYITNIYYDNYENDKYISIHMDMVRIDLCTKKTSKPDNYTYIYSKKDNKELSTKDFMNKESILEDMINTSIEGKTNNYSIFYNSKGKLFISYSINNSYIIKPLNNK